MILLQKSNAIDITRYARVLAHLRHFPAEKGAEVLARLGVRRKDWDEAAVTWKCVRDAERLNGQLNATIRFGRVLAETRAELKRDQPTIESIGSLPGPDGPVFAGTPSDCQPSRASTAATPASDVPTPRAVQVPSAWLNPAGLSGVPAGAADTQSSPWAHRPWATDSSQGAVPKTGVERGALGVGGAGPKAEWPRGVASTVALVGGAVPSPESVMPFSGSALGSAREGAHGAAATPSMVSVVPGPRHERMDTGTAAVGDVVALPRLPPGVPDLTLEQYASLRVELDVAPEQTFATLLRYGTSPQGRQALDDYWRTRFMADPLLRMGFARAYATYVAWRRSRGGP